MQRLRRLIGRRSVRAGEEAFVVEGAKLLGEALSAGAPIESVYLDPSVFDDRLGTAGGRSAAGHGQPDDGLGSGDRVRKLVERCSAAGCRVFELEAGVLARVADTVTPQPIMAVVGRVDITMESLAALRPTLVVVCADLRDPGNAGTVLRSAEAAGADGVVFADGSVDVYNPKTVRASAGALFHVPVVAASTDSAAVLDEVGSWGLRRWGTVADGGTDYAGADLRGPIAVVVGNEASGLPDALRPHLDELLTIPMAGRSESLNVSMATAVVCFEAARQRRSPGEARSSGQSRP